MINYFNRFKSLKLSIKQIVIILISLFVFSLAFPPSSLKLILDSDDSISNVISLEEKTIKLFEEDKESETYSDSIFTILTSINDANNFIFLKYFIGKSMADSKS